MSNGLARLNELHSYNSLVAIAAGKDNSGLAQNEPNLQIHNLNISHLHDYPKHPFKVNSGVEMDGLVKSITENGLLHPIVVRERESGEYEIISGHRRKVACALAGLSTIPAYIVDLTDDEATMLMVDANFCQRLTLSPSEFARALRIKSDAVTRHRGIRGENSVELIGKDMGKSPAAIKRYIRLSYLNDDLLDMVDRKKLGQIQGVDLSYLLPEQQFALHEMIKSKEGKITKSQARAIRFNVKTIEAVLANSEKNMVRKVVLSEDKIARFFMGKSENYIQDTIEKALMMYFEGGKSSEF